MSLGDITDEDYLDDPIKLYDLMPTNFHSCNQIKTLVADESDDEYLEDPIKLFNIRPTDFQWNTDINLAVGENETKNFNIYQIQFDKYILSDRKKLTTLPPTFSRIEKNIELLNECRPVKIKIVDCNLFPWYYKNKQRTDIHDNNEDDDVIIIDYDENSGNSTNIQSDYGKNNLDPIFSKDNSKIPQYKFFLENVNRTEIILNNMKVDKNADLYKNKSLYRLHDLNENKGKKIEGIIQKVYRELKSHNTQLALTRQTDTKNKGTFKCNYNNPRKSLKGVDKKSISAESQIRQNCIACPIEKRLNVKPKTSDEIAQESLKFLNFEKTLKKIDTCNKFYGSGDNIKCTNKFGKQFVTTNSLEKTHDMLHNMTTPCIKPTINNKQYQVCHNTCLRTQNNIIPHYHTIKDYKNKCLKQNLKKIFKNMPVVNNTNRKNQKEDEVTQNSVILLKSIKNYQKICNNNCVHSGRDEISSEVYSNILKNPKSPENNFVPSNPYSTFMKPSMPYRSNQSILQNFHIIPVIINNNNAKDSRYVNKNSFTGSNTNVHYQNNMLHTNSTNNMCYAFKNVNEGKTVTENGNPILKTVSNNPSPVGQDKILNVRNLYVNEKSNNICKIQSVWSGVTDIENNLNATLESSPSFITSNGLPDDTLCSQILSNHNSQPFKSSTISTNSPISGLSKTALISTKLKNGNSVKNTKQKITPAKILPICGGSNNNDTGFNIPHHACKIFPTFLKPISSSQLAKSSQSSVTKTRAENIKDIPNFGNRILTSILLPVGGYSPPILPITPYQKTLEIFEKNMDTEFTPPLHVGETKLTQNQIWNPKQGKLKRKIIDAENKMKKISLDEYKKRPLEQNIYN